MKLLKHNAILSLSREKKERDEGASAFNHPSTQQQRLFFAILTMWEGLM